MAISELNFVFHFNLNVVIIVCHCLECGVNIAVENHYYFAHGAR